MTKVWRGSNLQGSNPCRWGVLQQPRHKVYGFWRGPSTEHLQDRHRHKSSKLAETHLWPGVGFDLGELELCVVGVHLLDLLSSGGAQHLGSRFCEKLMEDESSTLMISTSWSTPLSPGKIGWKTIQWEQFRRKCCDEVADIHGLRSHPFTLTWPNISSAKTQPALHTSMFVV